MSTGFSQCFLYIPATMENKTYLKPAIDGGWWTDEIKITSTEIWACLGHQLVARRHDLDLSWPHRQRCRLWRKGHGKDLPHYFDMFWSVHMCSILWDSFESNIFELDVVSMSCQCRFHVGRLASLRWFWGSHFMPVANPGAGYKKLRQNCPRNNGRSRCISKVRTGNKCSNMWEILKRICTMALWFVSIVSVLWCFSMVKRHDRHVFTSTSLLFSKHLSA